MFGGVLGFGVLDSRMRSLRFSRVWDPGSDLGFEIKGVWGSWSLEASHAHLEAAGPVWKLNIDLQFRKVASFVLHLGDCSN